MDGKSMCNVNEISLCAHTHVRIHVHAPVQACLSTHVLYTCVYCNRKRAYARACLFFKNGLKKKAKLRYSKEHHMWLCLCPSNTYIKKKRNYIQKKFPAPLGDKQSD